MTLVLALGLAALVGVAVAGAARRLFVDERQSVRDYQQTLDTLRHLGERSGDPDTHGAGSPRRTVEATRDASLRGGGRGTTKLASSSGRGDAPRNTSRNTSRKTSRNTSGGAPPTTAVPAAPAASAASAETEVEAATAEAAAPPAPVAPGEATTRQPSVARAVARAARRSRVTTPVPAVSGDEGAPLSFHDTAVAPASPAVQAIASGRVPGPAGSTGRGDRRSARNAFGAARRRVQSSRAPRASGGPTAGSPRTSAPSGRVLLAAAALFVLLVGGVAAAVVLAGPHGHGSSPRVAARAPSPTVAPASDHASGAGGTLQPLEASSSSATYRVPATPVAIELTATGPCWVMATDSATGRVLWTGTMRAGNVQSLPAGTGVVLRLGAAGNVRVTADGRPVQLPSGFVSPFDATFRSA